MTHMEICSIWIAPARSVGRHVGLGRMLPPVGGRLGFEHGVEVGNERLRFGDTGRFARWDTIFQRSLVRLNVT